MSSATTPAAPWRSTTVEHDGLRLDVLVSGPDDGVPVLLLHGFPQAARSWTATARALAALPGGDRLRLLAPDQRGYSPGARPEDVAAYATDVLAEDALAVAAALGHDSFHLVGHDWGAAVAWLLAARRPDAVRSLVALSIPHLAAFGRALAEDPEQQRRSAYIGVFRQPGRAEEALLADDAARLRDIFGGDVPDEDVAAYVELMRGGALTPALAWYRAMGRLDDLPPVRVPTTYAWGPDDLAVAPAAAEACGDHVAADFAAERVDGAGHWLPDTHPDLVARLVAGRAGN